MYIRHHVTFSQRFTIAAGLLTLAPAIFHDEALPGVDKERPGRSGFRFSRELLIHHPRYRECYGWLREYQSLALFSLSCERLSLLRMFLLPTTSVWRVGARCNLASDYSYGRFMVIDADTSLTW
jgi:hypothetical protein